MAIILSILFITFSNSEKLFAKKKLIWQSYILAKALQITKKMQIIGYKNFMAVILDFFKEVFVVYAIYLNAKILIPLT